MKPMSAEDHARTPLVGVVMGSNSDWDTMRAACAMLEQFGVPFEARVVPAHRTPDPVLIRVHPPHPHPSAVTRS